MRVVIVILMVAAAASTTAQDLGNQPPVKATAVPSPPAPVVARQAGDTIATALVVASLPYTDSGTTAGYNDDYDEACPYDGSTAPDVVYAFFPTVTEAQRIDLCGSGYDTKVFVYDGAMNLVACNDDFYFDAGCGYFVSCIESIDFQAGQTYYIVIDGYGNASGDYTLTIAEVYLCFLICPDDGTDEGEPPLVPDYVDNWNGGCNTPPGHPFQAIEGDEYGESILCGISGWYLDQGEESRDTDWYVLTMGAGGVIEITADAEAATYVFELSPQDCASVSIAQQITIGACNAGTMTISGYAEGQAVWFWVGPMTFAPPDEYDYIVWFSGLMAAVATETTTWSDIKALYD